MSCFETLPQFSRAVYSKNNLPLCRPNLALPLGGQRLTHAKRKLNTNRRDFGLKRDERSDYEPENDRWILQKATRRAKTESVSAAAVAALDTARRGASPIQLRNR